jgi:hypothetical protein
MRSIVFAAAMLAGGAADAMAASVTMTCDNPRRAYQVVFNEASRSLAVTVPGSRTMYRVRAVDGSASAGRHLVVAGKTVAGGPDFQAHFKPIRFVEYFSNGKRVQTDACR